MQHIESVYKFKLGLCVPEARCRRDVTWHQPIRLVVLKYDADASQLHRFSHAKDSYMWQAQARHDMTWHRPIRSVMLEYDADVPQLHRFSRAKVSHMRQAQARRDIAWH